MKTDLIKRILAAKTKLFGEEDVTVLESFSEERLKALAESAEALPQAEQKKDDIVELTADQKREALLQENPDIAEIVEEHKTRAAARRTAILSTLEASKQDAYTKEELTAMPLPQLEKVAKLAGAKPVVDFGGAGVPRAAAGSDEVPAPIDLAGRIRTARAAEKKSA